MQHCTRCVVLMTLAWSITGVAQETQRPHTYVFAQPEMVSAQRVFGVGNAAMLLGQACAESRGASDAQPVLQMRGLRMPAILQACLT